MVEETANMEVTEAREWRALRENGYKAELPSGHVARLRPVSLAEMVKNGRIPNALTSIAAEAISNVGAGISTETIINLTNDVTDFLHLVTVASFVEPRVVILETPEDTPPEGAISIWDVSLEDQAFVLQLTGAPTRALESFRKKQAGNVGSEPPVQNDEDKAK